MSVIRSDQDEVFVNGVRQSVTAVDRDVTVDVNANQLQTKAQQALALNAAFLAVATPTAAQNAAQAKALTRQVNALIRLFLREFADVSDT